jgi:hypothetical protein
MREREPAEGGFAGVALVAFRLGADKRSHDRTATLVGRSFAKLNPHPL